MFWQSCYAQLATNDESSTNLRIYCDKES